MTATLAQLSDRARRKMGLGLGSHTITLTYASIADQDTVEVHGIVLTCFTGAPVTELAQFKKETNATATGANLADLINAIFDTTAGLLQSGVSASASSGVVTVTGARSITTSKAAGFAISASTTSDEPPFTSDFDQWILDGQLDVISKASFGALAAGETGKIIEEFNLSGADGSLVALSKPTNLLKPEIVTAKIGSDSQNYQLNQVSPSLLLDIRDGSNTIYKVDSGDGATKYWSFWNEKIQFSAAPASSSTPTIIGIKKPQTTKAGTNVWTVTVTDAQMAANDTITIDGIELIVKAAATTEVADFIAAGTDNASAQNLDDVIGNIFKASSGVSVSVATNVVTVTGARAITTTKAAAFDIAETTAALCDLPDHLHSLVEDYAVIQAWWQKNRAGMANGLFQKYLTDIQILNANYQIRR